MFLHLVLPSAIPVLGKHCSKSLLKARNCTKAQIKGCRELFHVVANGRNSLRMVTEACLLLVLALPYSWKTN